MMRDGFSLIEVIVGLLVFALGVMALSASTGFVSLQLQAADLRTERSVAVQMAAEQLRSTPFDDINSASPGYGAAVGNYSMWWNVQSVNWALKEVQLYSDGPGFSGGERVASQTDTLTIRIARPMK